MKKNLNRAACMVVAVLLLASISCKKKDSSSSPANSNKPKVYLLTKLTRDKVVTTYAYDANNRLISEAYNVLSPTDGIITFFQYDAGGHIIKSGVTNPRGTDTGAYYAFEYSGDNVVAYHYFSHGNGIIGYTEIDYGTYDYTNNGKIVTAYHFNKGQNGWGGFGADTITYDSLDNIIRYVDDNYADGYNYTVYQYDQKHASFNNPSHVKFPWILQQIYGANNKIRSILKDGRAVKDITYSYQYNPDGYPTSMSAKEDFSQDSDHSYEAHTETYEYVVR